MLREFKRISLQELKGTRPNPFIIETLKRGHPIIVSGVKEVVDLRKSLLDKSLKLEKLELPEYGFHVGVMKRPQSTNTHQNPIQDLVPAPPGLDITNLQESYRECQWPDVPGYKETIKELFSHFWLCC